MGIKCVCDTFLRATAGTISEILFNFCCFCFLPMLCPRIVDFLAKLSPAQLALRWIIIISFVSVISERRTKMLIRCYDHICCFALLLPKCLTAFSAECNGTENRKISFNGSYMLFLSFRFPLRFSLFIFAHFSSSRFFHFRSLLYDALQFVARIDDEIEILRRQV